MAVNNINAVNLRGKAKATQKKSGKPTKESIKAGMMGGFGSFSQSNDFGGTDWGNWGGDWGQQGAPPPPSTDQWGGGNWQNDMNWDFGGGYGWEGQGWGGANWGSDDAVAQQGQINLKQGGGGLPTQGKVMSSPTIPAPPTTPEPSAPEPPTAPRPGRK